jgi:hypothetical protein
VDVRERIQKASKRSADLNIKVRKNFTDYTAEDLRSLVSINIEGFLFITQWEG